MLVRQVRRRTRVSTPILVASVVGALVATMAPQAAAGGRLPGNITTTSARLALTPTAILTPEIEAARIQAQASETLGAAASFGEVLNDRTWVRNAAQPWYSSGTLKWKASCGKRDNGLNALAKKKDVAGWCWPKTDQETGLANRSAWVPQGIASTREGSWGGTYQGRTATVVSWYAGASGAAADVGSRISLFPTPAWGRPTSFTQVTLAEPYVNGEGLFDLRPAFAHAGGIAWSGDYLFVPQTNSGIRVFDLRQMYRVDNGPEVGTSTDGGVIQGGGARYALLEVARYYQPVAGCRGPYAVPFCFSSVSVDRTVAPARLVAAEYVDLGAMKRLRRGAGVASWALGFDGLPALGPDGRAMSDPLVANWTYATQGLVRKASTKQYFFSAGDVGKGWFVWERKGDGKKPLVTQGWPSGAEALTRDPATRRLWSVSEVPGRRTVFWVNECEMRTVKRGCGR